MRKIILMIVTAPIFWIWIGILEGFMIIMEGMTHWIDLLYEEEEDEEVAKEK